jgi:membrane protease YdiL (CAAX protease family)
MIDLMPLDAWSAALWDIVVTLAFLLVGLLFYSGLADLAIFEDRGRVRSQAFEPLDLFIAGTLACLFALLVLGGWRAANAPAASAAALPTGGVMIVQVLANTTVFLAVMFGIIAGLRWRGIDWLEAFGFKQLNPIWIAGHALPLLVCALPLIGAALSISQFVLEGGGGGDASRQEIVRFLAESPSDLARLVVTLSAVVLAPLQEEFIFRGYLYGVVRRYAGVPAGILINAALFAGIHLHAPSFAGLFVLAVCLTLAYEWTGSLLVPMAVHGLFNLLSILTLFMGGGGGG